MKLKIIKLFLKRTKIKKVNITVQTEILNMTTHYHITEDDLFQNYINSKPNLSAASKERYETILKKFTDGVGLTLTEIVENSRNQQDKVIERTINRTFEDGNEVIEKTITRFDVNSPDSLIKQYLNQFIEYCKDKGNKNITINNDIENIKSFLIFSGVEIPKIRKLKDDSNNWYLLEKEDLNYVINDSSAVHASLIEFLVETGMRITDALLLTIGDFMEATKEYHDYVNVDDFIDNAPDDMIGTWFFHPHKTRRFNIPCLTFNGPGSTKRILQNLRKIKNEYIPYAKRKYGLDLKMSKDDALFGSQKTNFKGPIPSKAIAGRFWLKNKKLREWRINKIKQKINKGELSVEDYEKEVSKIPKFHAHGCRKYFETMISRNCGDLRICTLLEGHVSPVATDSSYIKKEVEEVKEAYMSALDDLSLENMEVKVYTSEIRKEMEAKINELETQNRELKQQNEQGFKDIWDKINSLEEREKAWKEFTQGE